MNQALKTRLIAISSISILGISIISIQQLKIKALTNSNVYRNLIKKIKQQQQLKSKTKNQLQSSQQKSKRKKQIKQEIEKMLSSQQEVFDFTKQTSNQIRAIQKLKSQKLTKNHILAIIYNSLGAIVIPQFFLISMSLYSITFFYHNIIQIAHAKNGKQTTQKFQIKFKQISSLYISMLPFVMVGVILNGFIRGKLLSQLKTNKQITKFNNSHGK